MAHKPQLLCLTLALALALAACAPLPSTVARKPVPVVGPTSLQAVATTSPVQAATYGFAAEVLASSCALERCHNLASHAAMLDLSPERARGNLVNAKSQQAVAQILVISGDPDHSYLMAKVRGDRDIKGVRMPMGHSFLSVEQETIISRWIAAGAGQ